MMWGEAQVERYSRHIVLREIGVAGQKKFSAGRVLLIGVGGLGSPAALYLAAAGIGTLGLADSDAVDVSNLQRQIIHSTPDIGRPKVVSAREKIAALNPDVNVIVHAARVNASNIASVINDYDFIIDGTDNFASKFLINDACVLARKPFSHAGILRFDGQAMTYVPGHTCYRCVFGAPPPKGTAPTCAQAGVLGVVAGMLGAIQAAEALRFILGKGDLLLDRLLTVDALNMNFRTVALRPNPACPVCGSGPVILAPQGHSLPDCR
jgi:molybdopterin/thiamine biosynthesis adenylyltransferase